MGWGMGQALLAITSRLARPLSMKLGSYSSLKVGAYSKDSIRLTISSKAMTASRRASGAPGQMWVPLPKAMCSFTILK